MLLHDSEGVVHFLICTYAASDGVGVAVGVAIEVVLGECVDEVLSDFAGSDGSHGGSHVEGRTEDRTEFGVGAYAGGVCAEVSYVDREVEFVEEVAVFRLVHHVVDIVGAEGEAVVVGLAVVTADDTVLCEVAEREVVVNFFSSAGDGEVVVHDRSVVVEHHVLPVPAAAYDGVAVGVGEVVRIGVSGSLTAVDESLVLKDGVVGGVGNVAFFIGGITAVK